MPVALQGDSGKPRPALVVQSDHFADHGTVTLLLLTTALSDAPLIRIDVPPSNQNGLRLPSQIMVDKIMTVRREKIGLPMGVADEGLMLEVGRRLAVFLGVVR